VLITLLVVLLLVALLSGGYGHSRGWGYYGWSPLGLLVLIVLIMAVTGNLSF
jgi:formate hydrogenlyase subunit 3/multisubunit Na+/H+ antiporter MnhD subunit